MHLLPAQIRRGQIQRPATLDVFRRKVRQQVAVDGLAQFNLPCRLLPSPAPSVVDGLAELELVGAVDDGAALGLVPDGVEEEVGADLVILARAVHQPVRVGAILSLFLALGSPPLDRVPLGVRQDKHPLVAESGGPVLLVDALASLLGKLRVAVEHALAVGLHHGVRLAAFDFVADPLDEPFRVLYGRVALG
uniref:(northern house mosquito) hypothetical protein n=1 Tax=Culex pipiens TaxID=7175 RepID=A0A8D8MS22_CULPI